MLAVDPLLFTTLAYVVAVGEELKQTVPGVISCVCAPVVITSDRTPEPGVGSVVSSLPESEVLLFVSVYNVTHAACDVSMLYRTNPLAVEIDTFDAALLAIDLSHIHI